MPVIRKIFKVGDSMVSSIPQEIRKQLSVGRSDYIVWYVNKDNLVVVEKLTPKKHPGFFIPGTGWIKRER